MDNVVVIGSAIVAIVAAALAIRWVVRSRRGLGSPTDRATYETLHLASLASPALRSGLDRSSAERALRYLCKLLGTPAAALTDTEEVLAWAGVAPELAGNAAAL
ncbi:MAG: sensor histidine kinase, partial [Actinomycetia bacterium]|nr:sensor histidine kinase [Actinomycetes bacterium]